MTGTEIPGRVTGMGSWPGTSAREAVRAVRDLLGDGVPHVPELPARGPGADMVGRTAGLLVDLHVELQPSGWRLADRPGRDLARAAAFLREDLDEVAEAFDGWDGPLKVQVCGPWTSAAAIERPRADRLLSDAGACRDLAASLAEGVAGHVARVRALVPGARLVVQVDEPGLPAVLAGRLPTRSGRGRLRAVDLPEAVAGLEVVVTGGRRAGAEHVWLHCCDPQVPVRGLASLRLDALALDTTGLPPAAWEGVAAALESGTALVAGAVPAPVGAGARVDVDAAWRALRQAWRRVGLPTAALADVVVSPACGLAGSDLAGAAAALRAAATIADRCAQEGG